jgi:hypothetical protein
MTHKERDEAIRLMLVTSGCRTISGLSRSAKVGRQTVYAALHGRPLRRRSAEAIARALRVELGVLAELLPVVGVER